MALDVSSIDTWALWDGRKKPWYTIYKFKHFIGAPHDLYVFQQRKGSHMLSFQLPVILAHVANGTFKPFVVVSAKAEPPHFRPFGAGA